MHSIFIKDKSFYKRVALIAIPIALQGLITNGVNIMLRRFIPKGKPISSYTDEDICYFADCINGLPRKILGYRTPEELFEQELDKIYAA